MKIKEITKPIEEVTIKIIKEAIKIIDEKKPEEYTEEDRITINIANELSKIVKRRK